MTPRRTRPEARDTSASGRIRRHWVRHRSDGLVTPLEYALLAHPGSEHVTAASRELSGFDVTMRMCYHQGHVYTAIEIQTPRADPTGRAISAASRRDEAAASLLKRWEALRGQLESANAQLAALAPDETIIAAPRHLSMIALQHMALVWPAMMELRAFRDQWDPLASRISGAAALALLTSARPPDGVPRTRIVEQGTVIRQTLMHLLSEAVPAEQVAEFDSARQRATDADLVYEDHREVFHRVPTAIVHTAVNAAGTQLAAIGALDTVADAWLLTPDVLIQALRGGFNSTVIRASAEQQRLTLQRWKSARPPLLFGEPAQPLPDGAAEDPFVALVLALTQLNTEKNGDPHALSGAGASVGTARGRAVIVQSEVDIDRLAPGVIAVGYSAERWPPAAVAGLAGLVTQRDDAVSHAAVLARELAVPAVVAAPGAMELITDDTLVEINGYTGHVGIITS